MIRWPFFGTEIYTVWIAAITDVIMRISMPIRRHLYIETGPHHQAGATFGLKPIGLSLSSRFSLLTECYITHVYMLQRTVVSKPSRLFQWPMTGSSNYSRGMGWTVERSRTRPFKRLGKEPYPIEATQIRAEFAIPDSRSCTHLIDTTSLTLNIECSAELSYRYENNMILCDTIFATKCGKYKEGKLLR